MPLSGKTLRKSGIFFNADGSRSDDLPMTEFPARLAADTLWSLWKAGAVINQISPSCRPVTIEHGQATQMEFSALAESPVCGWKIAATSEGGQAHIGVLNPLEGPYLKSKIHESGVRLSMRGNHMAVAEAEFAFVLSSDIPARSEPYAWNEVLDAIGQLRPSLEFPDSRFKEFKEVGEACILADCAYARDCVLGAPAKAYWRNLELNEFPVQLHINGNVVTKGTGADALGDPRIAFTWLVNRLSARGIVLRSGQFVTTGVCGKPMPVVAGDHVVAELGCFGTAEAYLTD